MRRGGHCRKAPGRGGRGIEQPIQIVHQVREKVIGRFDGVAREAVTGKVALLVLKKKRVLKLLPL